MTKQELIAIIDVLEGKDHHNRNELLIRNRRWGTCGACPREGDSIMPEHCINTKRSDHHLDVRPETLKILDIHLAGVHEN